MSGHVRRNTQLRDVQRLYRFLAGQNPDAAKRAVQAVRQAVVRYRVARDAVIILAVRHQKEVWS